VDEKGQAMMAKLKALLESKEVEYYTLLNSSEGRLNDLLLCFPPPRLYLFMIRTAFSSQRSTPHYGF